MTGGEELLIADLGLLILNLDARPGAKSKNQQSKISNQQSPFAPCI
jgi:hypothetical protein